MLDAQYWLWRGMSAATRRLPLRLSYAVAGAAGGAAYYAWPRGRRNVSRNFRRVLPGAGSIRRRRIARASLANYGRYLVDFARLGEQPLDAIAACCEDNGAFDQLRRLLRQRNGAIIVPMHFGNWDAGAAAAVAAGFDLTVVGDRFGDPRLDALVFGARERLGMTVLPADRPGPAMVRPLRRGGLLALLLDRPLPGDGIEAQFFGAPVEVPSGPARLALRTRSALVPVAFPRLYPDRPTVGVLADFTIDTNPTGDPDADARRLTAAVMAAHERYIRCYPDQWYMFRDMWPGQGRKRC